MNSGQSPNRSVESTHPSADDESRPQVTLYSVSWCGWCDLARTWLERHSVEFDEITVVDFQPHRRQVIEISGQMEVPVITVNVGGKCHVFLEESDPQLHVLLGKPATS